MKVIMLFLTLASSVTADKANHAAESGKAHTVDLAAVSTAPTTNETFVLPKIEVHKNWLGQKSTCPFPSFDIGKQIDGNHWCLEVYCFPSTAHVLMADGVSEKQIDALRIGDITATGRVTNWIHREETSTIASDYLLITTGSTSTITISSKHMIHLNGLGFDFAGNAKVGDTLEDKDGKKKIISAIEKKKAFGKFAPLTTR